MNKTNSGALAVGAPNSQARFAEEANYALSSHNQYYCLMLTEEGNTLLTRFAKSVGCDFQGIKASGCAAEWIDQQASHLFCFLAGFVFCFEK